jgi:hypothetical protein
MVSATVVDETTHLRICNIKERLFVKKKKKKKKKVKRGHNKTQTFIILSFPWNRRFPFTPIRSEYCQKKIIKCSAFF